MFELVYSYIHYQRTGQHKKAQQIQSYKSEKQTLFCAKIKQDVKFIDS
jgi:hypothetical protein